MNNQSVSGDRQKVRLPLDHPEVEAVARRMHCLLCSGLLSEDEHGLVLKKYSDLRKVDYRLARRLCGRPLPATDIRPHFWDDSRRAFSGFDTTQEVEVWAGFVWRVGEYITKLEQKYRASDPGSHGPEVDELQPDDDI